MASADLLQSLPAVDAAQRFVFRGISWPEYAAFSSAFPGRRLRAAFDGSNLEIMTVSRLHDRLSRGFVRLLLTLCEELDLPISCDGGFTLDREDLDKGLEPDECFYIQHDAVVRGKESIDLTTDPPPDLAIEIDVTSSSVSRMSIYAKIGVPEVWRLKDSTATCFLLQEDGRYAVNATSVAFPGLVPNDLVPHLAQLLDSDDRVAMREFRAWVRDQIARGWPTA